MHASRANHSCIPNKWFSANVAGTSTICLTVTDLNAEAFSFCQYACPFGLPPTKTEAETSGPVEALA